MALVGEQMIVEMFCADPTLKELRYKRITLSRVPCVGEKVRILATQDGLTTAFIFMVKELIHNSNNEDYPRRENEFDAWITCEEMKPKEI